MGAVRFKQESVDSLGHSRAYWHRGERYKLQSLADGLESR